MVNLEKNKVINKMLATEYASHKEALLDEWQRAFQEEPPCRINEFGIIDPERYDTDNGILFIGRETNGWDDEEFLSGCLFRGWMEEISKNGLCGHGHIKKHPNMWYNIGRWIMLINDPSASLEEIAAEKENAIRAIGTIAFTNLNKIRGENASRGKYKQLIGYPTVEKILQKEVEIMAPKTIVCCGNARKVLSSLRDFEGKIIMMPHPGARMRTELMLQCLKDQLD